MILIGIDPSFSGTGITAEWNGQIIFQGELSSVKAKGGTHYINKILVDDTKMEIPSLAYDTSEIDDGDLRRIIHYHANLFKTIAHILSFPRSVTPKDFDAEDIYFCIEIPMGGHMGAGAKVDRSYAACVIAMNDLTSAIDRAGVSIYCVHPRVVKKAIAGNGNAKKDKVQEHLVQQFGYKTKYPKNFNISDSYAILKYMKDEIHKIQRQIL